MIVEDLLEMIVVHVKNHTLVLDANIANLEFQSLMAKMELLPLKEKDHFVVILAYRALPYTYFLISLILGKTTIIIAGGKEDDNTDLKVVEQLGEDDVNCQIPNLPNETSGNPSMFRHQGQIILCGGHHNEKQCLMLNNGTWSFFNELIYPRTFATSISTQQRHYIFGGSGESRRTSEYLDSGSHQWQRGPDIPHGMRFGCGVSISDTELVLIGGQGTLHRVIKLNVISNEWSELPVKLIQGRYSHSCALLNSKIIVAGGLNGGLLSSTEIIAIHSWNLTLGGCLSTARFKHGMEVMSWNKTLKLISFGGKKGSNEYLNIIEVWDDDNKSWSTVQNITFLQPKASFGYMSIPSSFFQC